jgi:hypothetical protein
MDLRLRPFFLGGIMQGTGLFDHDLSFHGALTDHQQSKCVVVFVFLRYGAQK